MHELYPPGHTHAGEPLLLRGGTLAQAAIVRPDNRGLKDGQMQFHIRLQCGVTGTSQ